MSVISPKLFVKFYNYINYLISSLYDHSSLVLLYTPQSFISCSELNLTYLLGAKCTRFSLRDLLLLPRLSLDEFESLLSLREETFMALINSFATYLHAFTSDMLRYQFVIFFNFVYLIYASSVRNSD
jgi:hypothetical protein